MLVYEAKLKGEISQYRKIDEAIRTGVFIRNACIRFWMDGLAKSRNDLYKYCKVLADNPDLPWAKQLNSQAQGLQVLKELGHQSVDSSTTVRKKYQGKKVILDLRKIVHYMAQLSTNKRDSNSQKIGDTLFSQMGLKRVPLNYGELVTYIFMD